MKEEVLREDTASENLTEYMAETEIENDWIGDVGEAMVVNIQTEFDDPTMLAEFEVELPDNSTGYLRFSKLSDQILETFLQEELKTTHTEMNVITREFPVVKTRYGWEAKIGDAPLRHVYEPSKESWLFDLNDIGMATFNPKIQYSLLILSLLPLVEFGLSWVPIVILLYIFSAIFIYVPFSVMLSPQQRDVKKDSVES